MFKLNKQTIDVIKANILIMLVFTVLYYIIGQKEESFNGINGKITWMDSAYFTLTTQSTAGYGDITPRSTNARLVSMAQQIIVLFEIISALSVYIGKH